MNNDWKPKPQTPEQVDEGLRAAFRQAKKDGVMDATPYLKQMTFNSDIQKTEKEIAVLQKKLELLKEIETHKSQPKMEFGCGGKFEIVSYNYVDYCRYEWNDGSHKWYKRKYVNEGVLMVAITDGETCRLLEGLWFNDVKHGKYDDEVKEPEPEPHTLSLYDFLLKNHNTMFSKSAICDIVRGWLIDHTVIETEDAEKVTFTIHKEQLQRPNQND